MRKTLYLAMDSKLNAAKVINFEMYKAGKVILAVQSFVIAEMGTCS